MMAGISVQFRRAVCGFRTEQTFAALEQALGDLIHLELHIDVSFDLLCDERINGLMQLPGMVAFMMLVPGSGQRWKTAFKTPMIASGGTANELHG
jgi:hypothetical protein